jgi:glycosyltransferase involved in cell wall biosynthesis
LCLGADAAGTTELIKDGETGFLYACGDAGDMSEKLKYILDNRESCAAIAKKGQEYMKRNMTADINADNIYKLYCEMLNTKNRLETKNEKI